MRPHYDGACVTHQDGDSANEFDIAIAEFTPPTPPTRLKIPPFVKRFTFRAVMSENLPRPIAPADDCPTSRIWHSLIASALGVARGKKSDEGTSMRPRYDGE